MSAEKTDSVLKLFSPVTLDEMDSVRLMNRFDTKYVFNVTWLPQFIEILSSDYKILEISGNRSFLYSTLYLDTPDFLFFRQHVTGKLERHKVRYRKYISTGSTFLEVKRKTNKNKTKKWRIENEYAPGSMTQSASEFVSQHIRTGVPDLQPVLENRFTRITLVGFDTCERITIDYDLSFKSVDGKSIMLPSIAVVELKRETCACHSPFRSAVTKSFLHPSSFSKYCIGNALLLDISKRNILKEKIILINKIENEYSKSALA